MAKSRHKGAKEGTRSRKLVPAAGAVAASAAIIATAAVQLPGDDDTTSADAPTSSQTSEPTAEPSEQKTPDRSDERASRNGQRSKLQSGAKSSADGAAPPKPKTDDSGNKDAEKSGDSSDNSDESSDEPSPEPPERSGTKYATTDLNVRTGPGEDYDVVTTLSTGDKIAVTDNTDGEWAEVIYEGEAQWVTSEYLSNKKPKPEDDEQSDDSTDSGLSSEPCDAGSEVESGLAENAVAVHRAVCAEFPEVTSYGGVRPGDDGEHGTGQALDIMIPSSSVGDQIADYVRSNAGALGVSEVIWSQQIWTVERSSEGWRPMEDRGSATANHFDHVHVTVY